MGEQKQGLSTPNNVKNFSSQCFELLVTPIYKYVISELSK